MLSVLNMTLGVRKLPLGSLKLDTSEYLVKLKCVTTGSNSNDIYFINNMQTKPSKGHLLFKPTFYNLKIEKEQKEFHTLIETNTNIEILDEIFSQLKELIKLKAPDKKFTSNQLLIEIKNHIGKTLIKEYGIWVYYPWLNKVIHLLDKEEFIDVRTNRNQNKITAKERDLLATKKIGIVGLSVGKSIALTIAQERICSEIFLADFDMIELSNLNRIQTGIQNIGVKKTIVAAREIAEIDPFLKITCFHEGLSSENIDEFFTKSGNLNICIEVCDGLLAKVMVREKAKELKIPVVMDTNDRGMIDVERFDLEPNRPIFHGLIDHLSISKLKKAESDEEKLLFIDAIIDFNSCSKRLQKSMEEIGKTISTWPQLASSVNLGGALTCNVCRRILLNEFNDSGRYFVDINEIINDTQSPK